MGVKLKGIGVMLKTESGWHFNAMPMFNTEQIITGATVAYPHFEPLAACKSRSPKMPRTIRRQPNWQARCDAKQSRARSCTTPRRELRLQQGIDCRGEDDLCRPEAGGC